MSINNKTKKTRIKKVNSYYFPRNINGNECDFAVGFYHNRNDEFLFDKKDYSKIKEFCWTASKFKNRITAVTHLNNGRSVSLPRYLCETPENMEVDHVNSNFKDNRYPKNLRNCTQTQNLANRPVGQGRVELNKNEKWIITRFAPCNVSHLEFDSEEEAIAYLWSLQDFYYGEYSHRASQKHGKENDSYWFCDDKFVLSGDLKKIMNLPVNNVLRINLKNFQRWIQSGQMRFDSSEADRFLMKLIDDYNDYVHQRGIWA